MLTKMDHVFLRHQCHLPVWIPPQRGSDQSGSLWILSSIVSMSEIQATYFYNLTRGDPVTMARPVDISRANICERHHFRRVQRKHCACDTISDTWPVGGQTAIYNLLTCVYLLISQVYHITGICNIVCIVAVDINAMLLFNI